MFNFNNFFKKEKPIPGILGLGGGGTGLSFGGGASGPGIFIEYVVIAGGGGGGGALSGGGGAGGMRTGTDFEVELGVANTVTVGTGGDWNFSPGAPTPGPPLPGNFANNSTYTQGIPGLDSYLGPAPGSGGFGNYPEGITSFGGGGGGAYFGPYGPYGPTIWNYAGPGGSGGGAACSPSVGQGNRPTSGPPADDVPGQGYNGGAGNCFGGGGGGGAGEAGAPHTAVPGAGGKAGKGGDGLAVTWPELPSSHGTPGPTPGRWFAGGGGGAGGYSGRGEQGDPGVGAVGGAIPAGGGAVYGGGGIASSPPPTSNNATMPPDTSGRSGAVIIRFPDSQPYVASGQNFASAPGSGKVIILWDSSGSITFN